MLRQRVNELGIANADCSPAESVSGFVSQHRVHLLMQIVCLTSNSCRRGLIVGALRIACNGLYTAARLHNDEDDPGCRLGCTEEQDCLRHFNACPVRFDHLNSLWPRVAESTERTVIFTDLWFKIAVRSEKLCILVGGDHWTHV